MSDLNHQPQFENEEQDALQKQKNKSDTVLKDSPTQEEETIESLPSPKRSSAFLKEALEYVEDYVKHMKGIQKLSVQEFKRRYSFSPLQYFHNELGI